MGFNFVFGINYMERSLVIGFFMGYYGLVSVKFYDVIDKVGFFVFIYKDEVVLRDDGVYFDFFLGFVYENYLIMLV